MTTQVFKSQRLIGPDIARSVAIIAVIAGHFFTVNTPYNDTPFEGASMFFQGFLKSLLSSTGVPFFILLTGFLCSGKTLSKNYYKGIKKAIIPYLVISLITWVVLSDYSLKELALGVLGFKTIGYAWYVEMYIGLFLLIPFLNMALRQVFDSGQTKCLILTALFLTALPPLFNRGDIKLIPGFWMMTFPATYYIIGATIREYQPHLKKKGFWLLGALALYAIAPVSQYAFLKWLCVTVSLSASYYSLINTAAAVIMFLLLYDIKKVPLWFEKTATFISSQAYEMFLFSYMIDKLVYPFFMGRFYHTQSDFIVWFVPIVLTVFTSSLIASYLYNTLSRLFDYAKQHTKTHRIW